MTLYNLTNEYMQLLELAENPEIDPQAISDTLEAISGEIEDKAQNIAIVIKELDSQAEKLSAEIQRLSERKSSIVSNIATLKRNLTNAMNVTGKVKFKTELFTFNVQKNPPALIVDNDKAIPAQYLIPQDPKIDKKAILNAIKSGEKVDYAHIEQTEGVRIK